jgi:hypothetical protein
VKRITKLLSSAALGFVLVHALAACGGDDQPPLEYKDPAGGALRLVKNKATKGTSVVLDLIVGDAPLTGYSTGFNLPLAPGLVTLAEFTPGTALDPGSAPAAALAVVPTTGPLAGMLVTAQSQKAAGTGAVATDTELAPKTVLFTLRLDLVPGAAPGIVFDGTAEGFSLPSGGLRDRAGLTVVEPSGVAIGKLEVHEAD